MTERPSAVTELERRLDDPAVASALADVLDHLPTLNLALVMVEGFLERGDTIIESIADGVHDLKRDLDSNDAVGQLKQLAATLPQFNSAITRLGELANSAEFTALMDSNVLAPETVGIVGTVGDALVESYQQAKSHPHMPGGALSLLRELKDPEVQKALGFLLTFAKRLGRQLG